MNIRKILTLILAATLLAAGGGAWAHGSRAHVGVYVGGPLWGPWWYPPVYYPPPVVVQPAPPPVYVEQNESPKNYWYYCQSAKGYYPYTKECPEGWQKVLPQPER